MPEYWRADNMQTIALFIISFILWMVLTWVPSGQEIFVGAIVSAVVAILFRNVFSIRSPKFLHPIRLFYFLFTYLPYFVFCSIKANIDVALLVLNPALPIHPGIVKAKTTLKTEVARTFLANSISLTPGTLTVDMIGEDVYIHWINIDSHDVENVTRTHVKVYDELLRRSFE